MNHILVNIILGIGQIILGLQSNDKAAQLLFSTLGSITLVVQALSDKLTGRNRGIVTIIALFPFIAAGIICGGLGIMATVGSLATGHFKGLLVALIYFGFLAAAMWILRINLKNQGTQHYADK